MSGLAISSFIVGLTGLAAIFDKSCLIWRQIAEARGFGEDIATWMRKLEMEFFRFQTWWMALERLSTNTRSYPQSATQPASPPASLSSTTSPLLVQLRDHIGHPITNAASNVLTLLEEIETILQANGVLTVAQQQQNRAQPEPNVGEAFSLRQDITEVQTRRRVFATQLFRNTPWLKRLKHDAAPWKETDKALLKSKLEDIIYWNQSLYSILPQSIQDSVLRQGIAGYLLDDEDEAESFSKASQDQQSCDVTLRESANLLTVRRKFREAVNLDKKLGEKLKQMELKDGWFSGLPETINSNSHYSVVEYAPDGADTESQVLVEWYPFPLQEEDSDFDMHTLAQARISQLSYLLLPSQKPSTLHTLDSIGFLDYGRLTRFGLVYSFPSFSSSSQPVTLFNLLDRKRSQGASFPYPTLEQRYHLAALLASSLYTFMLARWHHKRFVSSNIMFLSSYNSPLLPDLSHPFVGGFALSRPNAEGEISISGPSAKELDVYLHPDLRVKPPQKPPTYIRAFDIYSFGLLLVEIGFWTTLTTFSSSSAGKSKTSVAEVEPALFRNIVVRECKERLGCWMGERYRGITLRCLNVGDEAENGMGEGLNDFYWNVVMELIECAPSS